MSSTVFLEIAKNSRQTQQSSNFKEIIRHASQTHA